MKNEVIGNKYGRWTIISCNNISGLEKKYECICECSNKEFKKLAELKRNRAQSCSQCNVRNSHDPIKEIGKRYGRWTIIEQNKEKSESKVRPLCFNCKCDCGNIVKVRLVDMRNGRSSQCRDCRDKEIYINIDEMVGKKFGEWEILSTHQSTHKNNQRSLLCKCKCGKEQIISASRLKLKKTLQCPKCNMTTHGYEGTPTYSTWHSMKSRCASKEESKHKNYAGRGIFVCERWHKFESFLEDMGERPENKELDRKNNDSGYNPDNCRWVTKSENCLNRRKRPKKPE